MRNIFIDRPKAEFELVLVLVVTSLNEKVGPDGLHPSELLFGKLPPISVPSKYGRRLTTDKRINMVKFSINEMKHHLYIMRMERAPKFSVPGATDAT